MKLTSISYLLCFLFFYSSCRENQQKKIGSEDTVTKQTIVKQLPNNATMKQFDIEHFEKEMVKNPLYHGRKLEDGTYAQEYYTPKPNLDEETFHRDQVANYYQNIELKDNYHELYTYYNSGLLKEYKRFFSIEMEVGVWEYYDVQGNLIKSIDKDKGYPFTLNDVIAFGKKQGVDFYQNGDVNRGFSEKYKKNIWKLIWIEDLENGDSIEREYLLDGERGDVLSSSKRDAPIRILR